MNDEERMDLVRSKIVNDVMGVGRTIIGTTTDEEREEDRVPFGYTIGNMLSLVPDLLMLGSSDHATTAQLLNILSAKMIEELQSKYAKIFCDLKPDEFFEIDIGGEFPARLRWASDKAKKDYAFQAGQFYGTEGYFLLQVVICDTKGLMPTDEGVNPAFKVPYV